MSLPRVIAVAPGSPAALAGMVPGDEVVTVSGQVPRDVLEWRQLVDAADVSFDVRRNGKPTQVVVTKEFGVLLGAEVSSAVFDAVRTCDNHCEFCFIHQLPKGLRPSLYLKDDDYRLSFLYGNFTTLTRFTEADLERVVTEGLSPINVSIHATDPDIRSRMLRNRRGATSLRWLRALLNHGIETHGQVVVCPDINDGDVLDDTLLGVLDEYPELASLCVVPLGVSAHSKEPTLRPHSASEAGVVVDTVEAWQARFLAVLDRRLVFAADEYYLLAGRGFPPFDTYEGFSMHEDGIGMARAFAAEFEGQADDVIGPRSGFFAWVDGAPAEGYRAPRTTTVPLPVRRESVIPRAVAVLTAPYGAAVLDPLVSALGRDDVRILPVDNLFFGGNIAVTGLMVGEDVARVLADQPQGDRYLLPDVCLSDDRFLDGMAVADLPRPVEVVATDGVSLRRALAHR